MGCVRGNKLVTGAYGPMTNDVGSLVLAMKALLGKEMFCRDSIIPNLPFNKEVRLLSCMYCIIP